MKEIKDKLLYLKDEEIEELIGIGVISLERLSNLKDYYPFIMHYSENQRDDILHRVSMSLNHSINKKSTLLVKTENSLSNDEDFRQLNREYYKCSANRYIPMDNLIRVIFDFVATNNRVTFSKLYDYLRSYYEIRSFNRNNLLSLLKELDAIEKKDFVRPFELPNRYKSIEGFKVNVDELYEKLTYLKEILGTEYIDALLTNPSLFQEFLGDAYNSSYATVKIDESFINKLRQVFFVDNSLNEFNKIFESYSNLIQNEKHLLPIIETNLFETLIERYPEVNDAIKNLIGKLDKKNIVNVIDDETFPQLIDYLSWIFNSRILQARKAITNYFDDVKDPRNIVIFRERCAINTRPKTLEEIGAEYGITRERVRQITFKIARDVSNTTKSISDYLLYTNNQRTISVEFIKIVFKNFSKEVLFSLMTNDDYLLSSSGLQLVKSVDDDIFNTPFLNNKHLQFTEEEFDFILKNEVTTDDSVLINYYHKYLSQNYHRIGDIFVIRGLNNYKLLTLLIDQYFSDGIELSSDEQLEQLYRLYEEFTGVNDFADKTKRAVTARLANQLDLIGKGTYTSRRNFGSLSEATKVEIRDIAKGVLPKPVYYDYIFKNLNNETVRLDGIRNYHHLHGLMKVYMSDDYTYHKDYFAYEFIDAFLPEVERELLSLNRIITEKDLKRLSTSQSKTSFTNLNYSANWIYIGNNKYLPKSFIEREEESIYYLKQLAFKLLVQHDVFHISLLFPYIEENLSQLKDDFGIDNSTALSNLLLHINENIWGQRHNYLFKKDLKFDNRYDVTKHLIRDMDRISFQELYYRVSQIGDKVLNGLMLIDNLLPEYCRISEHEIIKTSYIRLASQQLSEVDAMIGSLLYSRNGIILSKLKSYTKFPIIDYEWNEHLLASVIRINFKHYRLIYTDKSYANTSYLIVNSSAPFETFEQFNKTEDNNE